MCRTAGCVCVGLTGVVIGVAVCLQPGEELGREVDGIPISEHFGDHDGEVLIVQQDVDYRGGPEAHSRGGGWLAGAPWITSTFIDATVAVQLHGRRSSSQAI